MNEEDILARLELLEATVTAILERLDKKPGLEEQHQAWVARLTGENKT